MYALVHSCQNVLAFYRYQTTYRVGDPILHIELRRWADIVLVAPCSANTLAKIAHGLCDNFPVSCCLALVLYLSLNHLDLSTARIITPNTNIHIPCDEHNDV